MSSSMHMVLSNVLDCLHKEREANDQDERDVRLEDVKLRTCEICIEKDRQHCTATVSTARASQYVDVLQICSGPLQSLVV
jgi:hypothetical protein